MAGAPPPFVPKYRITPYDCSNPANKAEIERLTALATQQQRGDPVPFEPRVQPWLFGCEPTSSFTHAVRHYIAVKGPVGSEIILGWLVAETRYRFGFTYVYLSEISVTRIKSDEHREIGKRLHAKLVDVSTNTDRARFIYLYPLTPEAKQAYSKWGYLTPKEIDPVNKLYDSVTEQFLMLEGSPKIGRTGIPNEILTLLKEPDPATFVIKAREIAFNLGDGALVERLNTIRRDAVRDPDFIATLKLALENIELSRGDPDFAMEPKEELDMLRKAVDSFKKKAGRRRTYRRRHNRRRTRSRRV